MKEHRLAKFFKKIKKIYNKYDGYRIEYASNIFVQPIKYCNSIHISNLYISEILRIEFDRYSYKFEDIFIFGKTTKYIVDIPKIFKFKKLFIIIRKFIINYNYVKFTKRRVIINPYFIKYIKLFCVYELYKHELCENDFYINSKKSFKKKYLIRNNDDYEWKYFCKNIRLY